MSIEIEKTPIEGLILIKPKVYFDKRGYFLETWNEKLWEDNGLKMKFVQENQSCSMKDALRGLHFQLPPFAQGKLVRVIQGSVLDVAVDIRKNSSTFGQSFSIELSGENFLQMYVPEGFAHGFLTLEDNTIFSYKCTNFYRLELEGAIRWDDIDLNINWGITKPLLSGKDNDNQTFKNFVSPF